MVGADAGSAGQTASTADVREGGTLGALTVVFLISAVFGRDPGQDEVGMERCKPMFQ